MYKPNWALINKCTYMLNIYWFKTIINISTFNKIIIANKPNLQSRYIFSRFGNGAAA